MSRQWIPFIIRDDAKLNGPGGGCGYLSCSKQHSSFHQKVPAFLSFSFCFRHLTFKYVLAPPFFFLVRKSLPLLYFSAKRSLHDFFSRKKSLPRPRHSHPLFQQVLRRPFGAFRFSPNVLDG